MGAPGGLLQTSNWTNHFSQHFTSLGFHRLRAPRLRQCTRRIMRYYHQWEVGVRRKVDPATGQEPPPVNVGVHDDDGTAHPNQVAEGQVNAAPTRFVHDGPMLAKALGN